MNAKHNLLKIFAIQLAVLAVLLWVLPAAAQMGTSSLSGLVVDASSKRAVPDAVVTATSPNLQGEQIVVTDSTGRYRVQALPPGDYTLRIEQEAYKPYVRPGIELRADTTIEVNIEILPEALKEEIVVVAEPPTVDIGSTNQGMNINEDFTRRVPVAPPTAKGGSSRSFETAATAAPGAQADLYGTSFNGSTSPENQYVIDGLSVNDPAFAVNGTPLSIEFIQEMNVITGGYMPEYGRTTGGFLNVLTQSGSNEFHGSVFGHWAPGLFTGDTKRIIRNGATVQTHKELSYVYDLGFDIGGPIQRDKLWFYGGVMYFTTKWNLERSLHRTLFDANADGSVQPRTDPETGLTEMERISGSTKNFVAREIGFQYIGKIDWAFSRNDKLSVAVFGIPVFTGGDGEYGILPQQGQPMLGNVDPRQENLAGTYGALAMNLDSFVNDTVLKYTRAFENRETLIDASLGWHYQTGGRRPVDGSEIGSISGLAGTPAVVYTQPHSITEFEDLPEDVNPTICDPQGTNQALPCPAGAQYQTGGPDYMSEFTLNRYQGKVMVTRMLLGGGHHVLKAGVDVEQSSYNTEVGYSGNRRMFEIFPGGFLEGRQYGFLTGPDDATILNSVPWDVNSLTVGGFLQDSWSIVDAVTLNAGLRYDVQILYADSGEVGMVVPNQWSPRVGVIYDFTRDGRSKVYGHAARYYESVPLDVAQRQLSGEALAFSAVTCDPNDPAQINTACLDNANRLAIGGPTDVNAQWITYGGSPVLVDPDLEPQSSDEFILGAEYEVFPRGRVGLTYMRRYMHRVIEDMSRDNANTLFIGNPGYGIARDWPAARREYDAITLYTDKRWRDGWLSAGSYTLSWLRGNYEGLFRNTTTQLNPNTNAIFDLPTLTVNADGPLPGDYRHQIKLFGAKEFQLPRRQAITGGLGFRAHSGGPTNYLGAHPIYAADEVFILPRGSGERLPWVFSIDPHAGYAFGLSEQTALELSVDVFNAFNFQSETKVDERYTIASVAPVRGGGRSDVAGCTGGGGACNLTQANGTPFDPTTANPNFGNAVQFQEPRTVRFGARMTF